MESKKVAMQRALWFSFQKCAAALARIVFALLLRADRSLSEQFFCFWEKMVARYPRWLNGFDARVTARLEGRIVIDCELKDVIQRHIYYRQVGRIV